MLERERFGNLHSTVCACKRFKTSLNMLEISKSDHFSSNSQRSGDPRVNASTRLRDVTFLNPAIDNTPPSLCTTTHFAAPTLAHNLLVSVAQCLSGYSTHIKHTKSRSENSPAGSKRRQGNWDSNPSTKKLTLCGFMKFLVS